MKVIDTLKNQLIEEKQKNLKIETEVRTELCDEFGEMMADVEKQHETRLQEEKDRASELSGAWVFSMGYFCSFTDWQAVSNFTAVSDKVKMQLLSFLGASRGGTRVRH